MSQTNLSHLINIDENKLNRVLYAKEISIQQKKKKYREYLKAIKNTENKELYSSVL